MREDSLSTAMPEELVQLRSGMGKNNDSEAEDRVQRGAML